MKYYSAENVRAMLAKWAGQYPSQGEAAKALGISPPHLCDMLRGHRDPSGAALQLLGMRRITRYIRDE